MSEIRYAGPTRLSPKWRRVECRLWSLMAEITTARQLQHMLSRGLQQAWRRVHSFHCHCMTEYIQSVCSDAGVLGMSPCLSLAQVHIGWL